MGSPYTSKTVSGYNSAPPPDDGSVSSANKVTWATIKTKLPDPILTLAQAINTALVTALDTSATLQSAAYTTLVSDNGKPINVTGTTTITLGDAATMGVGYSVPISNTGVATVTVALATVTDTLNGSAGGTCTIPANGSMTFTVNSGHNGYTTNAIGGALNAAWGINVPTGQSITGAGTAAVTGFSTVSATTLTGTLSTAAQPSITSLGTLTSLTSSGIITSTLGSGWQIGDTGGIARITYTAGTSTFNLLSTANTGIGTFSPTAATLPGTLGVGGNVTAPTFIGVLAGNAATVTTNANLTGPVTSVGNATAVAAAQPSITSVGTLTSLTSSGPISGTTGAFSNDVTSTGGNTINAANRIKMSYEGAGLGRINAYGIDNSTLGLLEIRMMSANASLSNTFTFSSTGLAVTGTLSATGGGSIGAANATGATAGYFSIPTSAGAPTGIPAGLNAGTVAIQYDTTNNFLYVYNGGWKKSTVYA